MGHNSGHSDIFPFHPNNHPRVASFSTSTPTDDHHTYAAYHDSANMGREDKPRLDIILDAPYLTLKGTGPDVEPTTLSGHVSLYLTEAISIKEITLQFRGKAKIPMPASESLINNSTSITYVVCNHDWSFLEGEKRHSRTLKAGRHFFPFHLEIGGSLPSSISTTALGGASVAYKLRAVASRPGLSRHLQAVAPVHILRSFTHEALEYQQTLEIENTWPEKMMYAIMVPHKAWAVGDTLAAVFKFSPLMKGVTVQSIVSSLCETTKVYARSGAQEDVRVVVTSRHEIINGKAVEVVDGGTGSSSQSRLWQAFGSAAHSPSTEARRELEEEEVDDYSSRDIVTFIKMTIPPSGHVLNSTGSVTSNSQSSSPAAATSAFALTPSESSSLHLPSTTIVTPSHSLEPISVSHRIRWSIYLKNRDGHISELRCSLPLVILDGRLLQESREVSVPTRRLMLGSAGLGRVGDEWAIEAGDGERAGTSGADEELLPPPEADRELPSYTAHVGDRVANMFLPEAVTMRVVNPWLGRVGTSAESPSETGEGSGVEGGPATHSNTAVVGEVADSPERDLPGSSSNPNSRPSYSGRNSNRNSIANLYHNMNQHPDAMGRAHLPHEPGVGEATPLDWVNSELLLSLSDEPLRRMARSAAASGAQSPIAAPLALNYAAPGPSGSSRWGSRVQSRVGSRVGSPERGGGSGRASLDGAAPRGPISRPVSRPPSPSGAGHVPASGGYGYEALSSPGSGSPGQQGHSVKNFFKATMKPFTALAHRHSSDKGKERESPPGSAPDSVGHSPLVLSRQISNSTPSPTGPLCRTQSTSALLLQQQHSYFTNIYPNGASSNPINAAAVADLARSASNECVSPNSMTGPTSYFKRGHDRHSHGSITDQTPQQHRPSPLADLSSRSELNSDTAASTSPTTMSGPALLHRALTEVPDYSIASRGFIGGVPPLSSMRGLPSYEEAARDSRRDVEVERGAPPSSGSSHQPRQPRRVSFLQEPVDRSSAAPSTTTATRSSTGKSRRLGTLSDSDIVGRFTRTGVHVPQPSEIVSGRSIVATTAAASREGDEDSDDSEGIQMQPRRRGGLM
ncbi:hypothetical protein M413DRAFT_442212 [Hebeloma cylindrosporum]|uniref:Arrestin C-terminal-like domain-containing protein n=1 Tax=Hebeloma cylindrosporum TaxID=76867 RepID=A0A0C3CN38_HEBCY|nr:hypothetical protein M413DRAFT_442212 [Hebeloma cylindrosporum h7]